MSNPQNAKRTAVSPPTSPRHSKTIKGPAKILTTIDSAAQSAVTEPSASASIDALATGTSNNAPTTSMAPANKTLDVRYADAWKRMEGHIYSQEFKLELLKPTQGPLTIFVNHLKKVSKEHPDICEEYVELLNAVLRHIGDLRGLLRDEFKSQEAGDLDKKTNITNWPAKLSGRLKSMEVFARLVCSSVSLPEKTMRFARLRRAIDRMTYHVKTAKELAELETVTLRRHVLFLLATHRIVLSEDVYAMGLPMLKNVVKNYPEQMECQLLNLSDLRRQYRSCAICNHRVQVYYLQHHRRIVLTCAVEDLTLESLQALVARDANFLLDNALEVDRFCPQYHRCTSKCKSTCSDNPAPLDTKYQSPLDKSGTPQIPGLFPHGPVTVKNLEEHRFLFITGGKTCGLVDVPCSNIPELGLFVDFPKFHELSEADSVRLERLAQLLHLGAWFSKDCTSNSAHQAIPAELRGDMKVLGFRVAYDGVPWGLYTRPPLFKFKDEDKYLDFMKHCMPDIAITMNMLFANSHGSFVAQAAQNHVREHRLPPFGAISNDETTWNASLGSNFTLSYSNFSNEPHLDGDNFRYVFSVYVFVDAATGELITDTSRIAACMKGGYLIWPDLHLALKIVDCTGVVILLWRGTHERHCTMTSETLDNGVIRYGTSIQVNKRLFESVQKYHTDLDALETWLLDGQQGDCPNIPKLPMDIHDV